MFVVSFGSTSTFFVFFSLLCISLRSLSRGPEFEMHASVCKRYSIAVEAVQLVDISLVE